MGGLFILFIALLFLVVRLVLWAREERDEDPRDSR